MDTTANNPAPTHVSPNAISLRTGAEYLRSLRDGRRVFVDGEVVLDVTEHRAFARPARTLARLFDIAAAPEMRERMTFPSPATGAPGPARLSDPQERRRSEGAPARI